MEIRNIKDSVVFNDNNLTKRVLFANKHVLSFVLNLKAGQVLPSHKHENSSLVLLVLSGSADLKINQEVNKIEKGMTILAKGEDDFEIPVVTEDLSLFVNITPNPSNHLYSKEF